MPARQAGREAVKAFRDHALNPEHPHARGSHENGDIFFQHREACNTRYNELPAIVEDYMHQVNGGESASKTGRKHIPTRLFKQAVNLSKQARAIEAMLGDITPFNAGKKKEEALSLLKKWFPQMENFSGQLKKYKVTINDLLAENEQLEARAKASEKGKMKDTMERAKLESELKDIQRLVDRIPPEVLAELKRQQRHTRER